MIYNYLELSIEELLELYSKNKNSIKYYQNKIKQDEKILDIVLIIFIVASLIFIGVGFYFCFKDAKALGSILGFIYLGLFIEGLKHLEFYSDEKEIINNLENQNEFIATILETKYKYTNY